MLSVTEKRPRNKNSVRCPQCGEPSKVTTTRTINGLPVRSRKCLVCQHRFTTRECIITQKRPQISISVTNLMESASFCASSDSKPSDNHGQ